MQNLSLFHPTFIAAQKLTGIFDFVDGFKKVSRRRRIIKNPIWLQVTMPGWRCLLYAVQPESTTNQQDAKRAKSSKSSCVGRRLGKNGHCEENRTTNNGDQQSIKGFNRIRIPRVAFPYPFTTHAQRHDIKCQKRCRQGSGD